MKFGVREICDVVLKAKGKQVVGGKTFFKDEPVCYFDSLKTSSMEAAATTVYAQGGRGNARLIAWEGERTVTFTMEDALISPEGLMILSGAGLISGADEGTKIQVHTTQVVGKVDAAPTQETAGVGAHVDTSKALATIKVTETPSTNANADIFVMFMLGGEIVEEPFIGKYASGVITVKAAQPTSTYATVTFPEKWDAVLVDYYVEKGTGAKQIEITPDKFGGNYYLEASTLFRDTNGFDMPAEFIIPNCKVQSNFTFTMASSGDPSTFTFTMDAFPDYTKFDPTKKVLSVIQIITEAEGQGDDGRTGTPAPAPAAAAQVAAQTHTAEVKGK